MRYENQVIKEVQECIDTAAVTENEYKRGMQRRNVNEMFYNTSAYRW